MKYLYYYYFIFTYFKLVIKIDTRIVELSKSLLWMQALIPGFLRHYMKTELERDSTTENEIYLYVTTKSQKQNYCFNKGILKIEDYRFKNSIPVDFIHVIGSLSESFQLKEDSIILHASAIEYNQGAIVFFAHPNAGKTSIVELLNAKINDTRVLSFNKILIDCQNKILKAGTMVSSRRNINISNSDIKEFRSLINFNINEYVESYSKILFLVNIRLGGLNHFRLSPKDEAIYELYASASRHANGEILLFNARNVYVSPVQKNLAYLQKRLSLCRIINQYFNTYEIWGDFQFISDRIMDLLKNIKSKEKYDRAI